MVLGFSIQLNNLTIIRLKVTSQLAKTSCIRILLFPWWVLLLKVMTKQGVYVENRKITLFSRHSTYITILLDCLYTQWQLLTMLTMRPLAVHHRVSGY